MFQIVFAKVKTANLDATDVMEGPTEDECRIASGGVCGTTGAVIRSITDGVCLKATNWTYKSSIPE